MLVRASSFLRKEIFEILRQPRLVLTLILGPFLILFLFGIGYRSQARPLRTLFVVDEESPLRRQIQEYATTLGPQLVYMGATSDEAAARSKLRSNEVDIVAVAPDNAYESIRNNEPAVFTLYHNEIDPFQTDYVNYFGQNYVDEVNRRVLQRIIEREQGEASSVQDELQSAQTSVSALRQALERGDDAAARQHQRDLDRNLTGLEQAVALSTGLLEGVQQTVGTNDATTANEDIVASLSTVRQDVNALNEVESNPGDSSAEVQQVAQLEEDLATLESKLSEFQRVEPSVMVSPFRSEIKNVAPVQLRILDYYAPSAFVLLLQHLAVTFAALSIVDERRLGTMELIRVSPISAIETLLSKYLYIQLTQPVVQ